MGCGSNNITFPTGQQGTQGPTGPAGVNGASVVYQSWNDNGAPTGILGYQSQKNAVWSMNMTDTGLAGGDTIQYLVPANAIGKGSYYEIVTEWEIGVETLGGTKTIGLRFASGDDFIKFLIKNTSTQDIEKVKIITRVTNPLDTNLVYTESVLYEGLLLVIDSPLNVYSKSFSLINSPATWITGGFYIQPACITGNDPGDILCKYMTITKFLR